MKRLILITEHIGLWLLSWFVIAAVMYCVQFIVIIDPLNSFYKCLFYDFTIYTQFTVGWLFPLVLLEDKRKQFMV